MKMVNSDKNGFSFKKCSAFQFMKKKVRRWMRNPKVTMEKGQSKTFLYPNSTSLHKSQMDQDLWYKQFPAYSCCHLNHTRDFLPDDQPCVMDKGKSCKVRKWKMMNKHHPDNKQKTPSADQDVEAHLSCPWSMSSAHLLAHPIMVECCVCSAPVITYRMQEAWEPRERAQAMDLFYPILPVRERTYCCDNDPEIQKRSHPKRKN